MSSDPDRNAHSPMRWLADVRWTSPLAISILIAAIVNVLFLALWLWSRGGQTIDIRFEAQGSSFTVQANGRDYLAGEYADAPATGTLILQLEPTDPIPSLPEPRGIDYVRVSDAESGEVLFEDDFSGDTLAPEWIASVPERSIVENGHLTQLESLGTVSLEGQSFGNVVVDLRYHNITGAAVMVRSVDPRTGVRFEMRPFRHYDSSLRLVQDGESRGVVGQRAEMPKQEVLKSLVAISLSFYPWIMGLLGVGLAAIALLQFVPTPKLGRLGERLQKARAEPVFLTVVVGGLALFAFVTTEFLLYDYGGNIVHVPDEVAYRFQARVLSSGRFFADAPPVQDSFTYFFPSLLLEHDGRWFSVYPFGHPLALAIGERFGMMHVIPPLVGALTVVGTFFTGRAVYNTRTGVLAAAVLALSPFFLMTASNFMSHNTAALYICGSLLFLALRERRPLLFPLLSGIFFGLLFNTRPLSAFGLIPAYAGLMLFMLWIGRKQWKDELRIDAAWAAGALVMLGAYAIYNFGTTGNPFEGQYQASATTSEVIGFGGRHSLAIGLQNEQVQLSMLALVLNNWPAWLGLGFVVLPFLLGTRRAWDWFLLASAVSIMGVYTFYEAPGIMHGPRYWYEAMPFLVLLAARGADRAAEVLAAGALRLREAVARGEGGRRPTWIAVTVVYSFVLFFVVVGSYQWLFGDGGNWNVDLTPHKASDLKGFNGAQDLLVDRIDAADLDNALVMMETCPSWQCYGIAFDRNTPDLDGDIVYAKDIPERNAEVYALYPDRRVYGGTYREGLLVPYGAVKGSGDATEYDRAPVAGTVPTPTPAPTATPDVAAVGRRDEQRRQDLAAISQGLTDYFEQIGEYPESPGITSLCSYSWDVGCQLTSVLDPLPVDPSPGRFYWYQSDGQTYFLVYARMEAEPGASECPEPTPAHLADVEYLYCARGP